MKDLVSSIFNIFKYTGRIFTCFRNLVFNLALLVILGVVIVSFMTSTEPSIPDKAIIRLDITGNIVEQKKIPSSLEKLFEDSLELRNHEPETSLQDLLDVIDKAAQDQRITGILLNLKNLKNGGLNQLLTIGKAIEAFRQTGKIVIASEDYYTQSQYLLASHADKIILNPMGAVDLHGFGVYRLYFREAIERLKIDYNIFKVGSHKSALEPFTRDSMSNEDRRQNELWLSSVWNEYIEQISKQRDLPFDLLDGYPDTIANSLEQTSGDAAQLALQQGLVDEVWTREKIHSYLETLFDNNSSKDNLITSSSYLESLTPSYTDNSQNDNKVGLIIAEGTILPGNQPTGLIGGDSLQKLIKQARKDPHIKALVLRINSGGGSAFASEIIRQELLELKKSGKPIVVSMGTLAASGGYWIAADADEIWASKVTITGSIGIFGAIPTFDRSLASLGIFSDGTGTSPLASGLDLTKPLPEQLKSAIQQNVEHNYRHFIDIVATGRKMEKSKVENLAQGRVYDGQAAKDLGLVDQLGSLNDAIESAAQHAKLENYSTSYIQAPVSVKNQLMQLFSSAYSHLAPSSTIKNAPFMPLHNQIVDHLKTLAQLQDPQNMFAFCPIKLNL